jgi:uncharacterized surface protein with fasciclin (FAS1) repeats
MVRAIALKNTFTALSLTIAAVLMLLAVSPAIVSAAKPAAAEAAKPGSSTIADIAISNGEFTTLVAALSCTDLVPAVSGNRQLTVFAPTDAAFAKLGLNAGNICTEISRDALTDILLYHVTSGRRISTSVLAAPQYRMLNGDKLTRTQLADAGIASTDISARNGVVHVINSVLLP